MIRISEPVIGSEEKKAINQVLDSGYLVQGKTVNTFERKFARFIGTKYAVATSSGTTALYLALLALGIGKGDEVITPSFSFISTSSVILFTGAKPIFVDVEKETFNINPNLIEQKITKKTKVILPVHVFGLPANMEKIINIAQKNKLLVIEDACQAHGAKFKNQKVGSFGNAGCFSFYATKNITTGEGGMVTTNNKNIVEKIISLRNHGFSSDKKNVGLGFNFKMTDLAAAIGIEQLKKLRKFNNIRKTNTEFLNQRLKDTKGLVTPSTDVKSKHSYHLYTLRVTRDFPLSRDQLFDYLKQNGIQAGIFYNKPIHKQKIYIDLGYRDNLEATESLSREVISLPIHPKVTKKDLEKIVKVIKNI